MKKLVYKFIEKMKNSKSIVIYYFALDIHQINLWWR